jgi:hypothetical protein
LITLIVYLGFDEWIICLGILDLLLGTHLVKEISNYSNSYARNHDKFIGIVAIDRIVCYTLKQPRLAGGVE